ncbi:MULTISPECIES: hypothetical protein [Polynucleobacter]|uniref:hypothetical protein n=1 Tax=Polynucleobacter TaxID=44013 RepID=UPI000AD4397B|nr:MULTISPECIES: hypothetical protein [Polynucleobacter]MBU3551879.1 hypothetical protein [Polynucleobacter sp. MWH-Post4-6-1]MBU3609301.1 hypothetical protein [Polynucleobacter wuianus]
MTQNLYKYLSSVQKNGTNYRLLRINDSKRPYKKDQTAGAANNAFVVDAKYSLCLDDVI